MNVVFYISSAVALLASVMVVTGKQVIHAALYLVVSLLAIAVVFFSLGAPFSGALEIIVYAGAIMVLIVFVIMLFNLGKAAARTERSLLRPRMWLGPGLLTLVLASQMIVLFARGAAGGEAKAVGVEEVARGLFGPYVLGVELASMLLLAGLVGAYHLGVRSPGAKRRAR